LETGGQAGIDESHTSFFFLVREKTK